MTFPLLIFILQAKYNEYLLTAVATMQFKGAPDKPCGVGRADANPKLLLNDT